MYTVLFENLISRERQIDLYDKIYSEVSNGVMDPTKLAFSYRDYKNTPGWFLGSVDDYLYRDAYKAYIFTINNYKDLYTILQIQDSIIQEHPQYDLSGCNIYVLFKNDNAYEDDIGSWFNIQRMMYNHAIYLLDVSQYGVVISRIAKDCNRYLTDSQVKKPVIPNNDPISPDLRVKLASNDSIDYLSEIGRKGLKIVGKIESGEINDPKSLIESIDKLSTKDDDKKEDIKPSKPDITVSIDDNTNIPSMKEWLSSIGYDKKEEDKSSTKKEKVIALIYNKDTDNYRKIEELMKKVYDFYRPQSNDVKFVLRSYEDFIQKDSDDNIEKYIIIADSMEGLYYLYSEYLDKRKCEPFTQEKDKWMLVANSDIYNTIDYNKLNESDYMLQSGLIEWALSNITFLL